MKQTLSALTALTALTFALNSNAATPVSDGTSGKAMAVKSGKVEFLAIGKPSFLKVRGIGSAPTGELKVIGTKASGEFSFELASLDTDIALRNEHMKDKYLEVGKFPKAIIRFKDIEAKEGAKATIPAELELHGVKKTISMDAELQPSGEAKKATGTFKFKLTDFGIAIPSHLGVTIADEVTVTIESVLQ